MGRTEALVLRNLEGTSKSAVRFSEPHFHAEAAMARQVSETGSGVVELRHFSCEDRPLCHSCGVALTPLGLVDGVDGELMECVCAECSENCLCEAVVVEREASKSS